jgi:non-ribosomal peptide synthetase component F
VVLHSGEGTEAIADQIQRHAVTHFQMTPTLARRLTQDAHALAALGSLKQMLLGKEALPASLVRELRTVCKGQIYNMYGATETTIWSTTYPIQELAISVPIGRPIANTQIHLLDLDLKPVPAGDVGELFIGGDGVARGYWGRPDLTAERFLTIPAPAASRLYRTGDLARYRPDGNLQFLGRVD